MLKPLASLQPIQPLAPLPALPPLVPLRAMVQITYVDKRGADVVKQVTVQRAIQLLPTIRAEALVRNLQGDVVGEVFRGRNPHGHFGWCWYLNDSLVTA